MSTAMPSGINYRSADSVTNIAILITIQIIVTAAKELVD